jgi:hypothetical protein
LGKIGEKLFLAKVLAKRQNLGNCTFRIGNYLLHDFRVSKNLWHQNGFDFFGTNDYQGLVNTIQMTMHAFSTSPKVMY